MKVIGLDQSTNSGWTFGSSKRDLTEWESGRFKAPKRDEIGERLIVVHDTVLALIDRFEPDLIAYETPFDPLVDLLHGDGKKRRVPVSQKSVHFAQHMVAAIAMAAARRSIPTEHYAPRMWMATLKLPKPTAELELAWSAQPGDKAYNLRRTWRKQEIIRTVRRMGAKVETTDEADSFGIAFHALHGKAGIKRATSDLFAMAKAAL